MPCDTQPFRPDQTLAERKEEVKKVVYDINALISVGKVKPIIDKKTGAVTFTGIDPNIRNGIADGCIYRRLMVSGSSLTKAAIQRAEAMAGRSVNKQAVAQGVHSHDGGQTWGKH